jgi:hypothetical protein
METGQSHNNRIKIRWGLNTVRPFKSAGTDGIVPALVQHEAELLVSKICLKYRARMAFGFVNMASRQVKVTFIPKSGKLH